jgi:hypothetical protein
LEQKKDVRSAVMLWTSIEPQRKRRNPMLSNGQRDLIDVKADATSHAAMAQEIAELRQQLAEAQGLIDVLKAREGALCEDLSSLSGLPTAEDVRRVHERAEAAEAKLAERINELEALVVELGGVGALPIEGEGSAVSRMAAKLAERDKQIASLVEALRGLLIHAGDEMPEENCPHCNAPPEWSASEAMLDDACAVCVARAALSDASALAEAHDAKVREPLERQLAGALNALDQATRCIHESEVGVLLLCADVFDDAAAAGERVIEAAKAEERERTAKLRHAAERLRHICEDEWGRLFPWECDIERGGFAKVVAANGKELLYGIGPLPGPHIVATLNAAVDLIRDLSPQEDEDD